MITIYAHSKKDGLKKLRKADLKRAKSSNIWIDLVKPTNEELAFVSELVNLHPITIEDIMELNPQIKYESFEHYTFVVFQGIKGIREDDVKTYPIHLIVSKNILITSRNDDDEIISKITEANRKIGWRLKQGHDYLFYNILDMGIDQYFPTVKRVGNSVERMREEILNPSGRLDFDKLFDSKRVVVKIRALVLQLSDLMARLGGPTNKFVQPSVRIYFRDAYDHTVRLNASLKDANDEAISILNEHLAVSSSKMNDIILVLTVFSAIMLPLTFVTGLYGMNVPLPLSNSPIAFGFILGIMLLIVAIMLMFFKRRKWI